MAATETARRPEGPTTTAAERVISAFWLIAGLGVCIYARTLGIYQPTGPDAGFFPMLAGILMAFTGAGLLLARGHGERTSVERWPSGERARWVLLVLGGIAVTIVLMRWIGFLASALVVMPLLLSVMQRRSLAVVLAAGWGSALAVWGLFGPILGTMLPRGPWGF